MPKINWKEELMKLAKEFYWLLCFLLAVCFIFINQTDEQFRSIVKFFFDKDFTMIAVIILGVIIFAHGIERILTVLFLLGKFVFKLIRGDHE